MNRETAILAKKTLLYFALFLVIMGLAIFLPAWSLAYWEGWVYISIFFVLVLLVTLYLLKNDPELLKRRLRRGPFSEKEKSQRIIQTFSTLVFSGTILFPGFDHRYGFSMAPWYVPVIGNLLLVVAYIIVFVVFKTNTYTSAIIETTKDQKVISTGPYAIVRHPMYSGAILVFIATPLALGSYWALLFVVPTILVVAWRAVEEEKFLSKNLSGYIEYCQKTRYRFVPYVW
ncbi:MAG: isoprenylcysteine carboxylmethyltransferase family protein [Caldisericales bacterium]|nr:isoprenylcysteine carboxylmethyltransferase family protein [Caldisericales bacterium]